MKPSSLLLLFFVTMTGLLHGQSPGEGKSVRYTGGSATVVFSASPFYKYDVQRSTNLTEWITLATTNTPDTNSIVFSDVFPDLAGAPPSQAFYRLIIPGPAIKFVVSGFPNPTTAGSSHLFTVIARDADGNLATGYRGTAHLTSSDIFAVLNTNYLVYYGFTETDAGVHTFSASLGTVGTQSISATDTLTPSLTGTQSGITVTPTTTTYLVVSGFPDPQTAGVAGTVTVTAKDFFGNITPDYTGTVHLTSSDAQAVLPADATLTSGVGTFSVTLKTAGPQSITTADTLTPAITGTQSSITVKPAAAVTLVVSGFPSPRTAGVSGNVTVTAKDAFGNTATNYAGVVHFTTSDPQSVLPSDATLTLGVRTFSVSLKTVGTQSIIVTDKVNSSITGTQSGITVNPAAAATFTVSGFPNPRTAGVAGTVTVTAKDAYDNVATGYTGTVHVTSSDPQSSLPADSAFTIGNAGVHSFSVTLKTVGNQSITATDTVNPFITGIQSGITVTP